MINVYKKEELITGDFVQNSKAFTDILIRQTEKSWKNLKKNLNSFKNLCSVFV